jgi:ADP-ribose pyrophosphatase YjhB (NUDIX family)
MTASAVSSCIVGQRIASCCRGCGISPRGHVEKDETLHEALGREIAEETGWELQGAPSLAYVADWEMTEYQ